jgi:2-amino-4-hydroxy-6-hydroxymethyldihydropteridine diphosphokinase
VSPARAGLDEAPGQSVPAVLALGANLGDRAATLQGAVRDLAGFEGLRVVRASPVVETDPVGGPDQPDYLNAVLLVSTTLSPLSLLAACQQVESEYGRTRTVRWRARTLDVDIISYDRLVAATVQLELPHPRAGQRAFVLAPWLAVDPDAVLPTAGGGVLSVVDLLAQAPDREGVRPHPGPALEVPS